MKAGSLPPRRVLPLHIMRHDLLDKEIDRAHRLVVLETAPLERTDEVIGAGGDVFIHIGANRVGPAGDDAEAGATAIPADTAGSHSPPPLFLAALGKTKALTVRLAVWQAGRPLRHPRPKEVRPASLFSL